MTYLEAKKRQLAAQKKRDQRAEQKRLLNEALCNPELPESQLIMEKRNAYLLATKEYKVQYQARMKVRDANNGLDSMEEDDTANEGSQDDSMEEYDLVDDDSQDEMMEVEDVNDAMDSIGEYDLANGDRHKESVEVEIILKSIAAKQTAKIPETVLPQINFSMKKIPKSSPSQVIENCQIWSKKFRNHIRFNYEPRMEVGSQFNFYADAIRIEGDGNCMFNSISTAIYGDAGYQADIRRMLVVELNNMIDRLQKDGWLEDDWVIYSVPIQDPELNFVDHLKRHKESVKNDTVWGTNFDLAVLGNLLKIRFGLFFPTTIEQVNYNFALHLKDTVTMSPRWPLVLLHNTGLTHYDLIKSIWMNANQDDPALMKVGSDAIMSFEKDDTLLLNNSVPMPVDDKKRLAIRNKKNAEDRRQRRKVNTSFEQITINPVVNVSSRAQRATNRSLIKESGVGPSIKKATTKPAVRIMKNRTIGCARDPTITFAEHSLGAFNVACKFCKAVFFEKEKSYRKCCSGHLKLTEFDNYPEDLKNLWIGDSADSKYLRNNARFFNSKFCFASMNATQRELPGKGPPVYVIRGPVYRLFNTAMPVNTQESTYAQLYLYGPERGVDLRITPTSTATEKGLITKLSEIVGRCNLLAKAYKSFKDFVDEEKTKEREESVQVPEYELRLVDPNNGDRVRNLPTNVEVAAIYYGNETDDVPERKDIFVTTKAGERKNIHHMDKNRDALTYPLLFALGNQTYDPHAMFNGKRISRITYYQNLLAYRPQLFNPIHYSGLLFQQFLVDVYTTVETDRLNYIKQLNAESRKTFIAAMEDFIVGDTNENHDSEFVKLYSSYVGSRRYMNLNYQDCMAIVLKYGKPTFFITMTCNPNWKEIKDNLKAGQKASDRNDLIARVFKHKSEALTNDLKSGVLGRSVYLNKNLEFQKRTLPHDHIIVKILSDDFQLNPTNVDECISAELPPLADVELRELVISHMTHNRCDLLQSKSPCWDPKTNKCSKNFPYAFQETTTITTSGKVSYKRSESNVNNAVDSKNQEITNAWIVPYNPDLLRKYRCHLNILACGSISSVKYIFKYAHKGADKLNMNVVEKTKGKDEINEFLEARYLGASEAMWRIMEYPMLYKDIAVYRLPVHLPTETFAVADVESNFTEWSKKGRQDVKSMLEAFFELNTYDKDARSLTYSACPSMYSFDTKTRKWKKRVRHSTTIGRIFVVSALHVEKFSLRQLLLHVPGPQCYQDLRTINDVTYGTFFEAAAALGLVDSQENFEEIMREVVNTSFGKEVREFFALLICYYPAFKEHNKIFNLFVKDLTDDYERKYQDKDRAIEQALYDIHSSLDANNYCGPTDLPKYEIDKVDLDFVADPKELLKIGHEMLAKANPRQTEFIKKIIAAVNGQSARRAYFLQGPAGCGKTFVYMILYYLLRGEGKNVVNSASTGIAATLLPSGQTSHSLFSIRLDIVDDNVLLSPINKEKRKKLSEANVLIIDEAPMFNKWLLGYINKRLQEVCKNTLPFGGKVIILGGDFRQTLPIIEHSTRSENVLATIKFSPLWKKHFELFELTQNMRVNQNEVEFAKWVLNVGDGKEENVKNKGSKISVPEEIRSSGDLIKDVFEDHDQKCADRFTSIILAPTNKAVDLINETVLEKIVTGDIVNLLSADLLHSDPSVDLNIQNLPIEYLNSLTPNGFPVHNLRLKLNCIVTVLRNLNIKSGVCNGTRLLVTAINPSFLTCQHIVAPHLGNTVLIPRINLISPEKEFPFTFTRKQFPVRLAYAMTINKSQGQTLSRVGLDLTKDCFTHGQLYVGLSRVKSPAHLFVSTPDDKMRQTNITDNIVFKEVFL